MDAAKSKTLLMRAASGNLANVRGQGWNVVDELLRGPFEWFASSGDEEPLTLCLFAQDSDGRTALDWARLSRKQSAADAIESAIALLFKR